MLLTHKDDGTPIALFVDDHERITVMYMVLDERMFSDTALRCVRLGPSLFTVSDIRYFNGRNVFETKSFAERQALLEEILGEFHQTDLVALMTVPNVPSHYPVRGVEYYDDKPGTMGVFLPAVE